MKRNFAALPTFLLAAAGILAASALSPRDASLLAQSVVSRLDSTRKSPTTFAPRRDSAKFYIILPPVPSLFSTDRRVVDSLRDFVYHRHAEDFFAFEPHFFLRDKVELGQQNELLAGGLGARHQAIFLDDVLLNDPISSQAIYAHLSSESFSELNLFNGFGALALSAFPVAFESKTQNIVAAKGYAKAHYYQFSGSTNKMDVTFALNLSERWSFYGGYAREGAEGLFRNSGGFGAERFGSASEANKFRLRLRYQSGARTYVNFAIERNSLNLKPFGGANLIETTRLGGDVFSPLSALIVNEFARRQNALTLSKVELQTALPFIPKRFRADSLNVFKAWIALARFSNEFQQTRRATILDRETSSRLSFGATQKLKLFFFSLALRGVYSLESVGENNTLANSSSQRIKPIARLAELSASAKTTFERLVFGEALEASASLSSTTRIVSNALGQNYATSFLSTGVGGEVNFPLSPSGESVLKTFVSISTTSRVPSLREVFSATDVQGAQVWRNERVSQAELGAELRHSDALRIRLSSLTSLVSSPYAIVQTRTSDTTLALRYQSLRDQTLSYSGLGLAAHSKIGFVESTLNATLVLDYSLLENPDRPFVSGLRAQGDTIDARSGRVFYLPRFYANASLYFRGKLFQGALDLKLGAMGYFQTDLAAALRNAEREATFFFNLIEQNGALRDNNLQFGTLRPKASIDLQLWAGIGSGMIFFFVENALSAPIFRAPFFPAYQRGFRLGVNWEFLD
ncbi:MAG: hypothetical protein NZM06_01875 [Chloroherpetonaceae bacterium]|nr:hypothetical protein [Chloroherpetonaceae bacterium]MDW8437186.1 hypothetical protein [Chloroherpetonaceae bacterium]